MKKYWVADIGGTNCRLAEFSEDFQLNNMVWRKTAEIADAKVLSSAFRHHFGSEEDVSASIMAMAGPCTEDKGALSNGSLCLSASELESEFSAPCKIVNDFVAQAYGLNCIDCAKLVYGQQQEGASVLVGAGTGLGVAVLCSTGGESMAFPSEGGHVAYPFEPEEYGFADFLREQNKQTLICAEDVLSGSGLVNLCRYLTKKTLSAKEIGTQFLQSESEVLQWFARFYGRFCRGWLLNFLPKGGLWITGGIALNNPLCVRSSYFRAEITKIQYAHIETYPVYLLDNQNVGLWGAAYLASRLKV